MNEHIDLAREWCKKAEHDLLNAEIVLDSGQEHLPCDTICFHCQQAVEKYLKGFLAYQNVDFPRTHFLGTLLDQCKEIDQAFTELDDVITLNPYAVDIRYPDEAMEIGINEAQTAYTIALRVQAFITPKIPL